MSHNESYAVAVRREFVARHFLVGGDWGAENELHEHHYLVEIRLQGARLDRHGYLIDIDTVTAALEDQVGRYRNKTLNLLPEFAGLNPSLEHLARIMGGSLSGVLDARLQRLTVRVWENAGAWAEYRIDL